ncbi:hypothetical protein B0H16DRAFT_1360355 [Mycena metata]|uniref:F-box domain-containing protein n=1 Tax=Mycena metata TaxID=1033252 RepID=A0AAD7K6X4_9AGAR|nr:hypothetical protein B0H16DRAFT_1360355 [Mycena metata]
MNSPFAHHLGTNYCPTDEEIPDIRALLVEPSLRLQRLNAKIAELQMALEKLAEERESLVVYMDGYKALISPLRRLPLDIIQEIFLACIPTHRNCVMSASEAPVLLGRICSSWRAIAYSTPRLWTQIHLVEPNRFYGVDMPSVEAKAAQRFAATKMWLDRSGDCPLSISLICGIEDAEYTSTTPSHTPPFSQALIPFAARWQHVDFLLSPAGLDSILGLVESDVPLLQSVKLQYDYPLEPRTTQLGSLGMLRGPRISSFCGSGNDIISENLPLRWAQLTVLAMTTAGPWQSLMTSESALEILRRCPELRTCRLTVNDGMESGVPSLPAIELKSLNTLELHCEVVHYTLFHLLDRLSLPELRNFALSGRASVPHDFPSLAKSFTGWPRLESVDITSNTFSKASLLESFRSLPDTVQELKIHDIPSDPGAPLITSLDDDALAILTPTDGLHPQCPVLEVLDIVHCTDVTDEAIFRFIAARMSDEFETKLKRVHFRCNRGVVLDILPSLQPFIENGLDVSINYIVPFKPRSSPWQGLLDAPIDDLRFTEY